MADPLGSYITRYDFLKALCSRLQIEKESGPQIFKDTGAKQYEYIYPAYKRGFIIGFPDQSFGPDLLITENEALIMIARAQKQIEPPWMLFSNPLTLERCKALLSTIEGN